MYLIRYLKNTHKHNHIKQGTSWANARVKLHSQVHFESKKILGQKECWVKKSFNSKKIVGPVLKLPRPDLTCLDLICPDLTYPDLTCPDLTCPDLTSPETHTTI